MGTSVLSFGPGLQLAWRNSFCEAFMRYVTAAPDCPEYVRDIFNNEELELLTAVGWLNFDELSIDELQRLALITHRAHIDNILVGSGWHPVARERLPRELPLVGEMIEARIDQLRNPQRLPDKPTAAGPVSIADGRYPPISAWLNIPAPVGRRDAAPIVASFLSMLRQHTVPVEQLRAEMIELERCDHITGQWKDDGLETPLATLTFSASEIGQITTHMDGTVWPDEDALRISNGLFRLGELVYETPATLEHQLARVRAHGELWQCAIEIRRLLDHHNRLPLEPLKWDAVQSQSWDWHRQEYERIRQLRIAAGIRSRPRPRNHPPA